MNNSSQYFFKCFLCWSSLLLPDTEHSCKVCCRSKNGTCSPYSKGGNFLFLRKGKPCTVGFCDEGVSYQTFILLCSAIKKPADPIIFLNYTSADKTVSALQHFGDIIFISMSTLFSVIKGKCMKQVQDVIERLWDFIDKLDINTFGKSALKSVWKCFQIQ